MGTLSWRTSVTKRSYSRKSAFQWRPYAREAGRLIVTVICSVLVTVWVQATKEESRLSAKRSKAETTSFVPTESWNKELNEFYSTYLAEVLRALRADRSLRLVKVEIPAGTLSYQRNVAATEAGGESFRLQPRAKRIPVIAVSRTAKDFLDEMRVTYIDPKSLPEKLLKGSAPALAWNDYLLIPDVTGSHAKRFHFGK